MYSFADLATAVRDPYRGFVELNCLYYKYRSSAPYFDEGVDIFAEDWDNLVILDACRADEYSRYCLSGGDLEYRISRAGATDEFLTANFSNRDLHDTIYVSGNPWYVRLRDQLNSSVYKFINVRGKSETSKDDGINELTIGPGPITAAAKRTAKRYPNKRLIVHYIQPHTPYIGPTGQKEFEVTRGMWNQVKESDVSDKTLRKAYRENLKIVLNDVEQLINELPGRSVVTADHGEYLGERSRPIPVKTYGHFAGLYTEPLVRIPWHVFASENRKSFISEEPEAQDTDESVSEQLEALGYKL